MLLHNVGYLPKSYKHLDGKNSYQKKKKQADINQSFICITASEVWRSLSKICWKKELESDVLTRNFLKKTLYCIQDLFWHRLKKLPRTTIFKMLNIFFPFFKNILRLQTSVLLRHRAFGKLIRSYIRPITNFFLELMTTRKEEKVTVNAENEVTTQTYSGCFKFLIRESMTEFHHCVVKT